MHILCATFRKTNMFTFRQSLYWNDPLSFSTVFSFSIKLVVLEQPPVLRTTDCPQQFLTTCSVFISEARFSFSCLSLVWIVRLFKSMGGRKKLAPSASSWDWLDVRKHSQFVLIVISVIYQNWLWLMSYKWERSWCKCKIRFCRSRIKLMLCCTKTNFFQAKWINNNYNSLFIYSFIFRTCI